jgi:hypothetical protein
MPAVDEVASTGAVFSTVNIGGVDYRLAVFDEDGQLVVTEGGDFEWLGVAGGGPGGSPTAGFSGAGAGGAGGLRKYVQGEPNNTEAGPLALSVNSYAISVGAGGTPAQGAGTNGEDTTIAGPDIGTLTCVGGGRGAAEDGIGATGGGSGGGGAFSSGTGGSGTSGQGNPGGTIAFGLGAGGGGAGSPGAQPNGGDGIESSIDGVPTYYAGGGGGADGPFDPNGGAGGLGGGGDGGDSAERTGQDGADGLGGGGGGGSGNANLGGRGGRGVVKVRWLPSSTPDEILADADITEDPDTLDAAATSAVQAASETHDVADTLNAEGTLAIQANLSAVDQADTLAGSAATALIAQAVITEAADSVLSTGGIEVVVGLDARFAPLEARVNRAMFRHLSNAVVSRSAGNEFRAILDVSDEPVDPLEGVQAGQARLTFPQQAPEVLEGEVITTLRLGVARQWRVIEDPRRQSDGVLVAVLAAA